MIKANLEIRLQAKSFLKQNGVLMARIALLCLFYWLSTVSTCFAINLISDTSSAVSGAQPAPPTKAMTDSGAFAIIYMYSMNFDYCGNTIDGDKFRKILQEYYKVCISNTLDGSENFALAKNFVQETKRAIAEKNSGFIDDKINKGMITNNCSDFLRTAIGLQVEITRLSSSPLVWNVPIDCDNYDWLDRGK